MLITNSPMLILRGPMGRDIAAFTDELRAKYPALADDGDE